MAIAKISEDRLAQVYDSKRRPTASVDNKEDLKHEGEAFMSYAPKAGFTYRFESFEDCTILKQPVRPDALGEKDPHQFLMSCESSEDGKNFVPDWISLNSFAKQKVIRKADGSLGQEPVHPTWYALGNMYARANKLCEMGSIKVEKDPVEIQVYAFTDLGKRAVKVVVDSDKKPVLNEDGSPKTEYATQPQNVYAITPAK